MNNTPTVRFWKLLRQYKVELRQIYTYAVFIGIVNLTLPLGIQAIINFLQTGVITSTWMILVGFVLVGIIITGILKVLQLRVVENIQQDLFARSAFEFAFRLPKIMFIQLDRIHAPELANRFFDTLTIQKGLPKILIDFSSAIFQIFFGLILLTIYSPYFIILGITLAFVLWVIFRVTGPKGLKTSLTESKYKYRMAHWLEEIARNNRSFKIHAKNEFHLNKTDDIANNYLSARESHFRVLINQYKLFIAFKVIVASSLLLLGGYLVFKNLLNIGQFVAAEIIIILIINSVEKVLITIDTIYDVLTALDKIGYVTDLELDGDEGTFAVETNEGLSVNAKDLEFSFPGDKNKVLDNLSFGIRAGEKVVLQGKSGSGKSLLLLLLSGIHKIDNGELYIDGVPIGNHQRDALYDKLGVSFPVNQIFEGTFKENILLGRDIGERTLSEILNVLNLEDYLVHQSKGINSFVDSGGRRLPRSIIQKILIARMIVNNPGLILMEDPLQFIGDDEKERIIDYIMNKDRNWTVIIVSDYQYWQRKSDRIINISK